MTKHWTWREWVQWGHAITVAVTALACPVVGFFALVDRDVVSAVLFFLVGRVFLWKGFYLSQELPARARKPKEPK